MISAIRPFAARLAAIELPVLALLVIGSIAVERLLPAALVVAAGFWLVRWLAYGRPTVRTPGDWPIGLLVIMVPVTLWATALPDVTRGEVLRLLMGVALYYAVANWAGSTARLLLVAAGLAAAGLALAALAPFLGGLPAVSGLIPAALGRVFQRLSSAVNPNVIAGALAVLAPLAAALFIFPLPRRWLGVRVLGLVAALAMVGVITLTGIPWRVDGPGGRRAGADCAALALGLAGGAPGRGCCRAGRLADRPQAHGRRGADITGVRRRGSAAGDLVARALHAPGFPLHRHRHGQLSGRWRTCSTRSSWPGRMLRSPTPTTSSCRLASIWGCRGWSHG